MKRQRSSQTTQCLNLRLGGIILFTALLTACQFPANISVGKDMNQTADNITALTKCPATPNCVCSSYADTDKYIEPIQFEGDGSAALSQIQSVINGMTRAKVVTATDRYLHAEFTSLLLRFVDDVEILVNPETSVLEVRSASRVGRTDFGVNRKRVEQIRQLFKPAP